MWHSLLAAFALMLVIEGLLPFANPGIMRQALIKMVQLNDNALRMAGLTSMLAGVILLYLIR